MFLCILSCNLTEVNHYIQFFIFGCLIHATLLKLIIILIFLFLGVLSIVLPTLPGPVPSLDQTSILRANLDDLFRECIVQLIPNPLL